MYGLLLENIIQYIQDNFGVDKWNEIRRLAQIEETNFHTHTVYPDVYTKNIIDKACKILRISEKQLLIGIGESFVTFIGRYGYDVVLSALGREFSDFLNSLDDLHEYLRLSYPRLKPPSYFCDNENEYGLILHYRTKRNFLLWYTVGQILKVAKLFYSTDVEIELLSENQEINEYHFILQLSFDNRVYLERLHNGLTASGTDYREPRSISRLSMSSACSPYNIIQQQHLTSNNNSNIYGDLLTGSGRAYSPSSLSTQSAISLSSAASNSLMISGQHASHSQQSASQATTSQQYYSLNSQSSISFSPITLDIFMDIFPFSIVYDSKMRICHIGSCLKMVCPNILGQNLTRVFSLIKPKIDFNWESILRHTNTTFELKLDILLKSQNKSSRIIRELRNISRSSIAELDGTAAAATGTPHEQTQEGALVKYNQPSAQSASNGAASSAGANYHVTLIHTDHHSPNGDNPSFLKLKGQMIYFDCWKCIVFLGAPNVANLDTLIKTGLYLNDLSMHDFSRDMVLAGQQQSAELKLALDQELRKSRQLEITIRKLDEERRRSDELLYQMIADKLRVGEKNIETCQYFSSVTILFSDIINFTEICSKIAPMDVVNMLNETYTCFDHLTEKHDIYKVETVGDAYMIAGGLPVHQEESSYSHARKVCLMARDMIQACHQIRDPSRGRHIKIRIGIHTGPVVGGIVGQKMPRYCLFGDTVNTSSRLETTSLKMKIQISEVTQRLLDPNEWIIRERGTIRLKGKGLMKTYWLEYRKDRYKSDFRSSGNILNMTNSFAGVDDEDDASDIEQTNALNNDADANYVLDASNNSKKYRQYHTQSSHTSQPIHDSNYSLFVDNQNRFKFPQNCLIS